jgi:hypothetical protein
MTEAQIAAIAVYRETMAQMSDLTLMVSWISLMKAIKDNPPDDSVPVLNALVQTIESLLDERVMSRINEKSMSDHGIPCSFEAQYGEE